MDEVAGGAARVVFPRLVLAEEDLLLMLLLLTAILTMEYSTKQSVPHATLFSPGFVPTLLQ